MKTVWVVAVAILAVTGCGAHIYSGTTKATASGTIRDEKRRPVDGAIIGMIIMRTGIGHVAAMATTVSDSKGAFVLTHEHKSQMSDAMLMGNISRNRPAVQCLACKKGYYTSHFSCAANQNIPLVRFTGPKLDSEQQRQYREWHLTEPGIGDYFTECDLETRVYGGLLATLRVSKR